MKWLLVLLMLAATPLAAVQPDEILADSILEVRARALSKGLRCLVCRNENIDDSNAELARDLRVLVRERLVAGDTDEQVLDFVVNRYGEYVLLKPLTGGGNWLLWASGPLMLIVALGFGLVYVRRRAVPPRASDARLNDDEEARLRKILEE
jgi:cytochrome c-type biogenesis protein CcmH